MRYAIFAFAHCYPSGGVYDFIGHHDVTDPKSEAEAHSLARSLITPDGATYMRLSIADPNSLEEIACYDFKARIDLSDRSTIIEPYDL